MENLSVDEVLKLQKDAYEMASELGYNGTFEEFLKVFQPGHPDPVGRKGKGGTIEQES